MNSHDPSRPAGGASTLVRVPVLDTGLPADAFASTIGPVSPARSASLRLDDPWFDNRYDLDATLGEGGMGVVRLAFDRRVGREIAVKAMRALGDARGDLAVRFLREACIQGQLEHPSVVPVYDLGRDPQGLPYFSMRRIRGETFEAIIHRLRAKDPEAMRAYSRRKLLSAFASVCQAVHFAHTRGVLHRDLKPANVMLADFGAVYVLDWGVAKLLSSADAAAPGHRPSIAPEIHGTTSTLDGATLGTPGYMSPEQLHGARDLDARADVYSLGAILFELLALEPLHRRETLPGKITSTMAGADARASVRAPGLDVAPELDAICVRATARERGDRYADVGALIADVERFLDGDRDVENRQRLAREHVAAARQAADEALRGGEGSDPARRRALGAVGRALALDPGNEHAMATLVRLLTEPPHSLPFEAVAELDGSSTTTRRANARGVLLGYLAWLLLTPLELWMGVRWPGVLAVTGVMWAAAAFASYRALRSHPSRSAAVIALGATAAAASATSAVCGPFVLVPTLAVINVMLWTLVSDRTLRRPIAALGALTILVPAVLEWTRALRFYNFRDGRVTILQGMLDFPPIATHAFLAAATLALVGIAASVTARFRDTLTEAEHRLVLQAWQLRQLVAPPGKPYE